MRTVVALLLSISGVAFGQSQKKINAQLQAELQKASRSYDSCVFEVRLANEVLENQRKEAYLVSFNAISTFEKKIKKTADEIKKTAGFLEQLDFDPNSIFKVGIVDSIIYPDYKGLNVQYKQALTERVEPIEMVDTLDVRGVKLKMQNLLLQKQIEIYGQFLSVNARQHELQRKYIDDILTYRKELDSMCLYFSNVYNWLSGVESQMYNKFEDLGREYHEKGPKGYNANYASFFPESYFAVHSGSDIKNGSEEFGEPLKPKESPKLESVQDQNVVFDMPDEQAEFVGGRSALFEFIAKNMRYPESALKKKISGKCHLKFIVKADGTISNVKVVKGIPDCPECDEEAIRVVKAMPKWNPGKVNGKAVNTYYAMPINFKIN